MAVLRGPNIAFVLGGTLLVIVGMLVLLFGAISGQLLYAGLGIAGILLGLVSLSRGWGTPR